MVAHRAGQEALLAGEHVDADGLAVATRKAGRPLR